MLIDFTFSNYSSFLDETTVSMETGERLRRYNNENTIRYGGSGDRLLKSALIFGANASGKSNLLSALNLMKYLILNQTQNSKVELPNQHFLLSTYAENRPTKLAIRFLIHEIEYSFSIAYLGDKFIKERLAYRNLNNSEEVEYYNIDRNTADSEENISHRENLLYAHYLDDKGDRHIKNLIEWFSDYLIIFNKTDVSELNKLVEQEKYKKALLALMKCADNNIIDIQVVTDKIDIPDNIKKLIAEIAQSDDDIPTSQIIHRLYTLYDKYGPEGDIEGVAKIAVDNLESTGTKHFIRLALLMLRYRSGQHVVVMDEFNESFHLELSKAVMKLIHSVNNKNQFLLTTHELQLLDCDLRIDQIYLLEKDFQGKSALYSLFDFSESHGIRSDVSYLKRYLNGQFGAIPDINVSGMLSVFEDIRE